MFSDSNSFEENVFIDNVVGGAVMYSRLIYFRRNIFAQPLNRWEFYIGKLLGLMIIIFSSMALGFGISGFIILFRVGSEGVFRYFVMDF